MTDTIEILNPKVGLLRNSGITKNNGSKSGDKKIQMKKEENE